MEHGYPNGIHGKQIPLEGQIIRVADEFDAITSKRQYKSHIGITDTLKILIENSKPFQKVPNGIALEQLAQDAKLGKINSSVLRYLFKVVINDTEYEISQVYDYLEYLKKQIKRLKQIDSYHEKMLSQKKESKKKYYEEGIKALLVDGETFENYKKVLQEYEKAYSFRRESIDNLFKEVKNIKRLWI